MTTITADGVNTGTLPYSYPSTARERQRLEHRRLTETYQSAKWIPFDDSSRLVFFSDCHRGNNSRADTFARNEELFIHALTHYHERGFTYIEVGDGDELWQRWQFSDVLNAHGRTFELLHKFDREKRLYLIAGNHDFPGSPRRRLNKDGIFTHDALILFHTATGQRIFVVHGHQADFYSDRICIISRLVVRLWQRLQFLGVRVTQNFLNGVQKRVTTEERIIEWINGRRQMLICGHTHRPRCAAYGAPPYFNTGHCVQPGVLFGLEIQSGAIRQIKWTAQPGTAQHVRYESISPPRVLRLFDRSM